MFKNLNPLALLAVVVVAVAVGLGLKQLSGGDWWEFAGFATCVLMIYLASVEHLATWPVGIVSILCYIHVFFYSKLFADTTLQFFFLALSIHGWMSWANGGTGNHELRVSRVAPIWWAIIPAIWIVGTAIYTPIMRLFKADLALYDSILTVGSIIAQLQQNFKKIENWILWIVIDAGYIGMYIYKKLLSTAALNLLLVVLAVAGLICWRRALLAQARTPA